MSREDFIKELKRLIASGEVTDIESFIYANEDSRTKAKKILKSEEYEEVKIRKHFIYVKK